jgi:hypothetical protein
MYNAPSLGFEVSPEGVGIEGGVILIHIDDCDPSCPVAYSYTDIFVLTALAGGLVVPGQNNRAEQAREVLTRLHRGSGKDRVEIVFLLSRHPVFADITG